MSGESAAPRRRRGAGATVRNGCENRDCMNYYANHNLAYDLTLFEEPRRSPATARGKGAGKKSAGAEGNPKANGAPSEAAQSAAGGGIARIKRRKSNFLRIAAGVILGVLAVAIIATNIHAQVQINELNQEKHEAEKLLEDLKSREDELDMQIAHQVSYDEVDKYAQEKLNMSKASNSQKEFISLREGDKAEVILEEDKNIFEKFADWISSLVS